MHNYLQRLNNPLWKLLPQKLYRNRRRKEITSLFNEWKSNGASIPPPHFVKQHVISHFQQLYGCETLIETGTFKGQMVSAQIVFFDKIISIELSPELHQKAKNKFSDNPNVDILQGDSGIVLHEIMSNLDKQCLFWLDGHYSGGNTAKGTKECPIYEELEAILSSDLEHIILIDDARLFIGENDYPTINELTAFISKFDCSYKLQQSNDIIRLTPFS